MTRLLFIVLLFLCAGITQAQTVTDSAGRRVTPNAQAQATADSLERIHSPRKAAIRSAILPGWGQIYNKKYWKLPLVYGALGTTAGIFVYNLTNYQDLRFAYSARFNAQLPLRDPSNPNQTGPFRDTTRLYELDLVRDDLKLIGLEQLRTVRNEFRQNIDYTVLVFIALWGLQVVDATVDAHLKTFDVSPDLSLRFKAGYSDLARAPAVGIVLQFK